METNKKFSIIYKIENYDEYIEKTINSIINQTLNFEKNIQIILLYAKDNPKILRIINEYLTTFPNNIILITNSINNTNLILNQINGEFVHLIKHKTCLNKDCLEKIYECFEKYSDLNIISLKNNGNKSDSKIIDLNENPSYSTLKLNKLFIKKTLLSKYIDENSEFITINKILLENKKYGILFNIAQEKEYYEFKKPEFFKDNYSLRKTFTYLDLIKYCLVNENNIPQFIQYAILNDIVELFEIGLYGLNRLKIKEIIHRIKHVINYMDFEVIQNINNSDLISFYLKYICYSKFNIKSKKEKLEILLKNQVIEYKPTITITNKTSYPNNFVISGYYPSLFECYTSKIQYLNNKLNKKITYLNEHPKTLSDLWNPKNKFEIKIYSNEDIDIYSDLILKYIKNNEITIIKPEMDIFKKEITDNSTINKKTISLNYKISVVMAIYNTEKYLKESIDSILNQNINFKENVQLILVDDGSSDSSKNIALKYQKKYPKNIIVLSQKNSGQAKARNNGLNHIQGEYVTFIDSDDYISKNAFQDAYDFLKEHDEEIDIVSIPLIQFGRTTAQHKLNYKFKKNKIIDLIKEPNNPQLSASSAFFKVELFQKYKFSTDVLFSEDSVMINEILFKKKKYGVINTANYYYRKRDDLSSTIDTVTLKKEYFTDKLKFYYMYLINYSLKQEGKVLKFIQYLLAYDIQWMIIQPKIYPYEWKWEENEFWYYLNKVISYIDIDVIENNPAITNDTCKKFFIFLKNNEVHYEMKGHNVELLSNEYRLDSLEKHTIWIKKIIHKENAIEISGIFISNFNSNEITIEAIQKLENNNEKRYFAKDLENENIYYLSKAIQYSINFKIKIPRKKSEISFIINFHKNHSNKNLERDNLIPTKVNLKLSTNVKLPNKVSYNSNKLYLE